MKLPIILLLIFLCPNPCFAGSAADSLWLEYNAAGTSIARVELILNYIDSHPKAIDKDSLLDIAIESAKLGDDPGLLIRAYKSYFSQEEIKDEAKARKRAEHILSLARENNDNELFYEGYSAMARIYLVEYQPENALDHVSKAYYHVNFLPNDSLKAQCMLLYGRCQERNNNKVEALRKYMDALYLAEKSENTRLLLKVYENLADYFLLIHNHEKALTYRKRQLAVFLQIQPVDSLGLMKINLEFSQIFFYENAREEGQKRAKEVLAYASRNKVSSLFSEQSKIYRTYLIEQGNFSELSNFYTKDYPQELDKLAQEDTVLYYRVKAFITEVNGHPDSALWYNQKAEQGIYGEHNIYISNFFKRFGQFYTRRGDIPNAINKMEQAHQFAKMADYLPYLIETSRYLDSLYHSQGNTIKAYEYSKLNKEYSDRQNEITRSDEILRLEIDNEVKQQELKKQREEEETSRRHNLQYMGMVIIIAILFVALLMMSRIKMHSLFIKSMGFISFIFFFEFIILLADHKIHHATHGEPWKIMAIKVVLIGFLLPLHHWTEEKVVHYLIKRKRVSTHKISVKGTIRRIKKKLEEQEAAEH